MWLVDRFRKIKAAVREPAAVSKVDGFSIALEKKQGVLLTSKPKDKPDAESKPASVDSYYQVSVTVSGENPEYPATDKPWTHRYTTGLKGDDGYGFVGGVSYIPYDAQWTGFELVEEFDEARRPPDFGKWMPPHHTVMLRAHFIDVSGRPNSMAVGGWVRKSEKESEAWKMAASSPVTYF